MPVDVSVGLNGSSLNACFDAVPDASSMGSKVPEQATMEQVCCATTFDVAPSYDINASTASYTRANFSGAVGFRCNLCVTSVNWDPGKSSQHRFIVLLTNFCKRLLRCLQQLGVAVFAATQLWKLAVVLVTVNAVADAALTTVCCELL